MTTCETQKNYFSSIGIANNALGAVAAGGALGLAGRFLPDSFSRMTPAMLQWRRMGIIGLGLASCYLFSQGISARIAANRTRCVESNNTYSPAHWLLVGSGLVAGWEEIPHFFVRQFQRVAPGISPHAMFFAGRGENVLLLRIMFSPKGIAGGLFLGGLIALTNA